MKKVVILVLLTIHLYSSSDINKYLNSYNQLQNDIYHVKVSQNTSREPSEEISLSSYEKDIIADIIQFQGLISVNLNEDNVKEFLKTNELIVIRVVLSKSFYEMDLYLMIYLAYKMEFLISMYY